MSTRALGRYHLRAEIGRGTMGVVYRAYDPVLEREIALKTVELASALEVERRAKFLARFFQEAKIAARLLHPNIVVTHDASSDETAGVAVPFIAMELVKGGSLADRLARDGALDWREALELAIPIARGLGYAHRQGVVHRDVKPANVMLTEDGTPKIADFGIARLPTSELTQTGAVLGTPYFMSPEQLEADAVDGRSDLFSLGALLYTLVSGRPPFRGTDLAAITHQVLYKDPRPLSEEVAGLPESFDGVLARTMAKRTEARYVSGEELASDLERLLHGERPSRAIPLGERTLASAPAPLAPSPLTPSSSAEPALDAEPEAVRSSPLRALVLLALGAALAVGVLARWEPLSAAVGPVGDELRARAVELSERLRDRRAELDRRDELEARAAERLRLARDLLRRSHWDEASEAVAESLTLARDSELGPSEARALLVRGLILAETGEWSKARADLDAAGSIFEIYDEPAAEAEALVELADLERDQGELERAESLYARALVLGAGDRVPLGRAVAALFGGDRQRARRELERLAEGSARQATRARAQVYLAGLAAAAGEHEEVERRLAAAEPGLSPGEAARFRGYAARLRGDEEAALSALESSAERARAEDDPAALASALEGMEAEPAGEGALQFFFLAAPRSARNDLLRSRLPADY